ncbi:MAG: UDP-N-acetyl-D-mannosamine dehydrogenase [Saprospirales bacterium]|nr:MAG: UDP-N-acetyl-D-mannosamine dehydrogenase [Saprospirales bacterium]
MKFDVQFIGLGYIGLPTAAIIAQTGKQVYGVDINPSIVEQTNKGQVHFSEPGLAEMVAINVKEGRLKAGSTAVSAKVHLVVVPTPFNEHHEPDTSYVRAATEALIPNLEAGDIYIIESTSPVGTTEKMANFIFEQRPDLVGKLYIAYCPERILPGNALQELKMNDRVVGGIDEESTQKAIEFYKAFVLGQIFGTNARTAEMCKLVENSSRDVQIAFANELSLICDKAGINVWELIELANKHPRVSILQPGSGVGGHCIAVDPYFITADYPMESQLIGQARKTNNYKAFWCAEKIQKTIQDFKIKNRRNPVVAMMGLAFKPNIDDLRESPAKFIVQKVMQSEQEGFMIVEPNIPDHDTFKLWPIEKAYFKADIVVFLVAHNEFKKLPYNEEKIILDFCGVFKK